LAQVSANLGTLDFSGRRKAVEALVDAVVAGKDPMSWRIDVMIPVGEYGASFTSSTC
jgi:hypothetical protein